VVAKAVTGHRTTRDLTHHVTRGAARSAFLRAERDSRYPVDATFSIEQRSKHRWTVVMEYAVSVTSASTAEDST
jgi:hypothetical protein